MPEQIPDKPVIEAVVIPVDEQREPDEWWIALDREKDGARYTSVAFRTRRQVLENSDDFEHWLRVVIPEPEKP